MNDKLKACLWAAARTVRGLWGCSGMAVVVEKFNAKVKVVE